jgi:hypothetical protein
MEHEEQAEKLADELDRLDEHSDEVGEQIDDARRDWEAKEEDLSVPGAQPDPDADEEEQEESVPGVAADEETLSEEGGP